MLLSKNKQKFNSLFIKKKKNSGRNNTGRITVAHQGGGHKQKYRKILFNNQNTSCFVTGFEYDPNRTAFLAKICTIQNNLQNFNFVLAPQSLKILDPINPITSLNELKKLPVDLNKVTVLKKIGSCYFLFEFRVGDFVYNVEISPNKGPQLIKAGGTFGVIIQKLNNFVTIKLPSGEFRLVPDTCRAYFGNVSNENHFNIIWKKAGKSRWLNIRPTVRGVAKNPIDHPHGGNTSGGCHPVTPWAKLTKGKPTRSKKKKKKNWF